VDASCISRSVQAYAPELNKLFRPYLKPTNKSYRIDETYIKVSGEDKYLYRALDSTGQTIDFLLTATRDTAAAKRFLRRAIEASGNPMPRVIHVDKTPAYLLLARREWPAVFGFLGGLSDCVGRMKGWSSAKLGHTSSVDL
jgi:IS6 family transposase